MHADDFLFGKDVAGLVVSLYPNAFKDGTFDDVDATEEILGNYFSLVSTDVAKELVMDAYAKND